MGGGGGKDGGERGGGAAGVMRQAMTRLMHGWDCWHGATETTAATNRVPTSQPLLLQLRTISTCP